MSIPLGFARVCDGVYRSAYPATKTLPFVDSLKLRSVVCLYPKDLRADLRAHLTERGIKMCEADVGANQEPFLVMSSSAVSAVLRFIDSEENRPVLIFCTNGKVRLMKLFTRDVRQHARSHSTNSPPHHFSQVRTGCLVGCLRKQQGWSLVSIIHELEQGSEGEAGLADASFIETFQPTE